MRLLALCLGLLVAACGTDQADAPDAGVDASLAPSIAATPSATTVAPGDTLVLSVITTNFKVVNPNVVGPAPVPGEGHYHYYLDDAVNYVAAWTPTVGVRIPSSAVPGGHMVRLVLVASDHEYVTPVVETTVTFTVQ